MTDESTQLEIVRFNPGDYLFREGESNFHFFVIRQGKVEIFKKGSQNEKIGVAVVEEGQSIGEFALLDRQSRSATAQALDHVTAIKVSEEAYQSLLDELPEWAKNMLESLAERIRKANEVISHLNNRDKRVDAMEFGNQGFRRFKLID